MGGKFQFILNEPPEHINIVANTGDGHKGSITLAREALRSAFEQREDIVPVTMAATTETRSHSDSNTDEILQKMVLQEEMLREIKRDLEQLKKPRGGVSMDEVLAGIGFIIGLTGLAAYCLARRESSG